MKRKIATGRQALFSLGYLIPLMNADGKFLAITIFGDPSNFYILQDLIASFEWVQ